MTLAMLGWIVAALMAGLWWGERGRRRAAERWAVTGHPEEAQAAVSHAPSEEAEDRFQKFAQEYTEEAVERGVADLKAELKAAGHHVGERQLRREVEQMLSGQDVLE